MPTTMTDPTGERAIPTTAGKDQARFIASAIVPSYRITSQCNDYTSITSTPGTIHGAVKILCTLPTVIVFSQLCIERPDGVHMGFADSVCTYAPDLEPEAELSADHVLRVGLLASMSRDCVRGRYPYRLRYSVTEIFMGVTLPRFNVKSKARMLRCR
jgi:hypothetical protein